jgi:phosphoserine phosphatase
MPSLFPQAKGILYALKEKGIDMAIASRSPTSDIAKTFIDKLNLKPMFVAQVSLQELRIFFFFFLNLYCAMSNRVNQLFFTQEHE